jgi:hypothetical protein
MSKENKTSASPTVHTTHSAPGMEFDEFYEAEFLRTGNPIYVWNAIHSLQVHEFLWAAHQGVSPSLPRSIPPWCIKYLVEVASRIRDLSLGLDPALRPNESDEYSAWVEWGVHPTLKPKDAARRLPSALEIDWTNFTNFQHTDRAARAEHIYTEKRSEGLSARKAEELAMQELGIENERTLRRYFAEARQRGVKPPG